MGMKRIRIKGKMKKVKDGALVRSEKTTAVLPLMNATAECPIRHSPAFCDNCKIACWVGHTLQERQNMINRPDFVCTCNKLWRYERLVAFGKFHNRGNYGQSIYFQYFGSNIRPMNSPLFTHSLSLQTVLFILCNTPTYVTYLYRRGRRLWRYHQ